MIHPPLLLRARVVLPVTSAALEDGAVLVDGGRIAALGQFRELRRESIETIDLGDSILFPGLVNAHCHLDYTDMTGLPAPRHFSDWIKSLLTLKAAAGYTEYATAWLRGARMLVGNGTTTVGDIEAVPELLPEVWSATPLRVLSFLEMTGVKNRREPAAIIAEAVAKIESLEAPRCAAGLSPHALYSTSPLLLKLAAEAASARGWRVAMHIAESAEEAEMYAQASGPLHDWLRDQRDMSDCGGVTCVRQAATAGLLADNFLAVHCNYVSEDDAALLARGRSSVAHCPRSHAYFSHMPFPHKLLVKAGVNICLGTDSLASVQKLSEASLDLSLFAEMRLFASRHPDVRPSNILEMATINGARALGRQDEIGRLCPGARADVAVIPLPAGATDYADAVAHHCGAASAVMIDGQWVIAP